MQMDLFTEDQMEDEKFREEMYALLDEVIQEQQAEMAALEEWADEQMKEWQDDEAALMEWEDEIVRQNADHELI